MKYADKVLAVDGMQVNDDAVEAMCAHCVDAVRRGEPYATSMIGRTLVFVVQEDDEIHLFITHDYSDTYLTLKRDSGLRVGQKLLANINDHVVELEIKSVKEVQDGSA